MVLTKEKKEQKLSQLKDELEQSHAIIFSDLTGLKMAQQSDLKKKLKEKNIKMSVVKNSLMRLALKEKGIEIDQAILDQPILGIFSEDEVEAAKIIIKENKDNEILSPLGAIVDKKYITGEEIVALSKLPGRSQLQAMLVGSINAPIANFVYVLKGNLSGLVSILRQVSEKV